MNTISYLPTTLKSTAQTAIANMTPLPKTYKAAVFEKADAPITLKDVTLKHPSPGEVLVKVIACGGCRTYCGKLTTPSSECFAVLFEAILGGIFFLTFLISRFRRNGSSGSIRQRFPDCPRA